MAKAMEALLKEEEPGDYAAETSGKP